MKAFRAVVLPTLLYACETWAVYQRHTKKLNHFHITCLGRLLNVTWQDKIPDTEMLNQAALPSLHAILMLSHYRWAGHVARMPAHRLPKRLLGELQQGNFSHGGQNKRFRDTLKTFLKVLNINPDTWEQTAVVELDDATLSTKVSVYENKEGQLWRNKRDRQGKPAPAIKSRSPTLPSMLSLHIPCTHRLEQPSTYPQVMHPSLNP